MLKNCPKIVFLLTFGFFRKWENSITKGREHMANYPPYYGVNPYVGQMGYGQTAPQQMAQQSVFACRPVTSREEAIAAQTDYFSSGLVMPDLAHGIIWLKRFNPNTGASDFYEFHLAQPEQPKAPEYVTREEFNEFVNRMKHKEANSVDE